MIEIKSRWDSTVVVYKSETAQTVREAVIEAVGKYYSLSRANLSGANLYGANLSGADLYRADGIQPERCTPLLMLLDQPGPIRMYKLVTKNGCGPFNGGIQYKIGQSYEVTNADCDTAKDCGIGIHVATLDWCLARWETGYKILIVEFVATDIACIPTATDGKIRLHRCKVVGKKNIRAMVTVPKPTKQV